jgi:FtsZ-interacting cell division protein ZipA
MTLYLEGNMQDKNKLYLILILLIVVVILIISSIFKAPKKVSNMLENKKNMQVEYDATSPEQIVVDENKLVDEEKSDVKSDQDLSEEIATRTNA